MSIDEWETLDPQHNSSNHLINIVRTIDIWVIVLTWAPLHPRFSHSERHFNEHIVIMAFSRYILFSLFHHTNFCNLNLHWLLMSHAWCNETHEVPPRAWYFRIYVGSFQPFTTMYHTYTPIAISKDSLIIMVPNMITENVLISCVNIFLWFHNKSICI